MGGRWLKRLQPRAAMGILSDSDSNGHPAIGYREVSGSIQDPPEYTIQE